MRASQDWTDLLTGQQREQLESLVLPAYLRKCRWFGGKARQMQELTIVEAIPLGGTVHSVQILLMRVIYADGGAENYVLPLACAENTEGERIAEDFPHAVISHIELNGGRAILYDGVYNKSFGFDLLSTIVKGETIKGSHGELVAYAGKALNEQAKGGTDFPQTKVLKAEQSNTAILFGNELFFKLYRHPERGINPDLEIVKFLTETVAFPNIPAFAGGLEHRSTEGGPISIGILQSFVPNRGDSWSYFLESVQGYYQRVLTSGTKAQEIPSTPASFLELSRWTIPPFCRAFISSEATHLAELLGRRTGELHKALASASHHPDFSPEPFSHSFQISVFESMEKLAKQVLQLLENNLHKLPRDEQPEAEQLLISEHKIMTKLQTFADRELSAMRIRIHGDYHLGQVLYTGNDFIIIDFEGEPARSLAERRMKQSSLKDVAGMIRSFHYAAYLSLLREMPLDVEGITGLAPWADLWCRYMGGAFLKSYLDVVEDSRIVPADDSQLEIMLKAFLLEKAVYELGYELNNRPEWVLIPVRGIKYLLTDK